ncbi:MAG TPA: hypothetical protein VF940_02655 [Streptosporangiaceae bacterium]
MNKANVSEDAEQAKYPGEKFPVGELAGAHDIRFDIGHRRPGQQPDAEQQNDFDALDDAAQPVSRLPHASFLAIFGPRRGPVDGAGAACQPIPILPGHDPARRRGYRPVLVSSWASTLS